MTWNHLHHEYSQPMSSSKNDDGPDSKRLIHLTLFEAGMKYDSKVGGTRHLSVRWAFEIFEAAWESANPLDPHRLHAWSRTKEHAEDKLRADILRRLER
jgi:hypothetical protein